MHDRNTLLVSVVQDIKGAEAVQRHGINTVYSLYQYSLLKVMPIQSNSLPTHFLHLRVQLQRSWGGFTITRPRRNQTERTQCNISCRSIASLSIYRAHLWSDVILGALEVFLECCRWLNVYFSSGFSATRSYDWLWSIVLCRSNHEAQRVLPSNKLLYATISPCLGGI